MASKRKSRVRRDGTVEVWEWTVAAFGLLLVIGLIGFTMSRIIIADEKPPHFVITTERVVEQAGTYLVDARIENLGDRTAAGLVIEGELFAGDNAVELSTATLSYAPAHSTRHASLLFTKDPRTHRLVLRPVGFEKP